MVIVNFFCVNEMHQPGLSYTCRPKSDAVGVSLHVIIKLYDSGIMQKCFDVSGAMTIHM